MLQAVAVAHIKKYKWTLFNAHLLHTGNFCLLVIEIKYEKTRAL